MPRSRSRSPRRDRRRSRSRDRDRKRKERRRSRSRSPHSRRRSRSPVNRRRSRSPDGRSRRHRSPERERHRDRGRQQSEDMDDDVIVLDGPSNDDPDQIPTEDDMMKIMGFGSFDSTKGKHVPGNDAGTASAQVIHKRKYRQYMNRKGGFNRPLDFIA